MLTFDVSWGSMGTSILGNAGSAASNTRTRLPSILSFRFLWLWCSLLILLLLLLRKVYNLLYTTFSSIFSIFDNKKVYLLLKIITTRWPWIFFLKNRNYHSQVWMVMEEQKGNSFNFHFIFTNIVRRKPRWSLQAQINFSLLL